METYLRENNTFQIDKINTCKCIVRMIVRMEYSCKQTNCNIQKKNNVKGVSHTDQSTQTEELVVKVIDNENKLDTVLCTNTINEDDFFRD